MSWTDGLRVSAGSRRMRAGATICLATLIPLSAWAQQQRVSTTAAPSPTTTASDSGQPQHQHRPDPQQPQPAPQHEMQMQMAGPLGINMARDGSGTSWLPDMTPMYAVHRQTGAWGLMGHGSVFLQYIDESGPRGDDDFGSIHWFMGMAHRDVGGGPLTFRGMLSLEPATVGKCGYPDLLASGETCNGEALHDRQHPHDLFMELAVMYQRAINDRLAYQLYGALAGEPSLGPVAYPHRISAMPNPIAPVTHHWLDSSHIAFGVVSAGLYQQRWKVEGSVFNGREPDEERWDLDLGQPDSFAGRVWFLPTGQWALQFSAGHLEEAEEGELGEPRVNVERLTASATYHRRLRETGLWATTVAWGQNQEEERRTNALLAETALQLDAQNNVFGRAEIAEKTGHDLALPEFEDTTFTVSKLAAGYMRQFRPVASWVPGVGAGLSFSIVPDRLRPVYDGRVSVGFTVFLNLRPMEMAGGMQHQGHAAAVLPSGDSSATTLSRPRLGARR
jgi:hypothetical protein